MRPKIARPASRYVADVARLDERVGSSGAQLDEEQQGARQLVDLAPQAVRAATAAPRAGAMTARAPATHSRLGL